MPGHLHLSLTMAQPEENKCKSEFSSQKQELGREMGQFAGGGDKLLNVYYVFWGNEGREGH